MGPMPRPALRIALGVGCLRQRGVDGAQLAHTRRSVDRRPNQGVTKRHPSAQRDQPQVLSRRRRLGIDAEVFGGAPQQGDVPQRLNGGGEQEPPGIGGHGLELAQKPLLDASRHRRRVVRSEAELEFRRRQPSRQLEQCERVTTGFGDNAVTYAPVEGTCRHRVEQRACIFVAEPADPQFGEPSENRRHGGLAHREQHCDRIGIEAPRDELEGQRRGGVEPLGIVDEANEWRTVGHLGEQTQHGQAEEERVWRRAHREAEDCADCSALWSGQVVETVEHRHAHAVQSRERERHLGLDSGRPCHPARRSALAYVLEQRGLADPGLASEHEDPALAGLRVVEKAVERLALVATAPERVLGGVTRHLPHPQVGTLGT